METYVDDNDGCAEDGDPYGDVEIWPPVLDDEAGSGQVCWSGDDVFEVVVPTGRKAVYGKDD
jgi:hypothetical protein